MAVTIPQAVLTSLQRAVRSMATSTQEEVKELADACILDLSLSGVWVTDKMLEAKTRDGLVLQALKLYCKGHYGYDAEADVRKFQEGYKALKISMALSGDYEKGA